MNAQHEGAAGDVPPRQESGVDLATLARRVDTASTTSVRNLDFVPNDWNWRRVPVHSSESGRSKSARASC
jgi:hypothetical protein